MGSSRTVVEELWSKCSQYPANGRKSPLALPMKLAQTMAQPHPWDMGWQEHGLPTLYRDRHTQQDCWVAKVVSRPGTTTADTQAVHGERSRS